MIINLPFEPSSSLHDFQFYSVFYGEPFLFEDYIYYFDGKDARIIGYDRTGKCISRSHLKKLIEILVVDFKCRSITLDCPSLIKGNLNDFLVREVIDRPNLNYDFEILIHKADYDKLRVKKNVLRFATQKFIVVESKIDFSYNHLRLLENFVKKWGRNPFYRSEFISSIYLLTNRTSSNLVSCYFNNKLVGFTIISSISDLGVIHYNITINEVSGVSDILYYNSINLLFKQNIKSISLGFSLNRGLFLFKNKWCGSKHWKGGFELLYRRSSNFPFYMWATRLVRNL